MNKPECMGEIMPDDGSGNGRAGVDLWSAHGTFLKVDFLQQFEQIFAFRSGEFGGFFDL